MDFKSIIKKHHSVESYAISILADHDCDCYTYGGTTVNEILRDIKEAYPGGMEYPYVDVANAIANISRIRPIIRAPYQTVVDTDEFCDNFDGESFEAAKADAEDTLINWMCEERGNWNDFFCPTDEELYHYNYMIYNCSVRVDKYNPDTDEYEEAWSPSYEDEKEIGWFELTREILTQQKADCDAGMT